MSLFDNPPDLLAIAGAYNKPGRGGACVGALLQPADADLRDWSYTVYAAYDCPASSLKERVGAIARLLVFPQEEDQGFMKLKAHYDRIRCLDYPEADPGASSLHVNQGLAMEAMLGEEVRRAIKDGWVRSPTAENPDNKAPIDLKGFIYKPVDLKAQAPEIIEWMDGLLSVIVDKRIRFAGLEGLGAQLLESLRSLSISSTGKIENDEPLLMSMLFSVGRAEYLAQTRQMPLQIALDAKRKEAIAAISAALAGEVDAV